MCEVATEGGHTAEYAAGDDGDGVEEWHTKDECGGRNFRPGKDGDGSEEKAERHTTGVAEEDARRMEIPEEKSGCRSGDDAGKHDDGGLVEVVKVRTTGEDQHDECGNGRSAGGESGQAVEPVQCIRERDDPDGDEHCRDQVDDANEWQRDGKSREIDRATKGIGDSGDGSPA